MSAEKMDARRFEVLVAGKHQGGSFATEAEAKAAGEARRSSPQDTVEVRRKGPKPFEPMLAPVEAPAAVLVTASPDKKSDYRK